jgi:TolB-like protein/Tfp pilus assembly protein PilF
LARVATGLNFANKHMSVGARRRAFLYAASNLKDYIKLNHVEWPTHGAPFGTSNGEAPSAAHDADGNSPDMPSPPPVKKEQLVDTMMAELPSPHKPSIIVIPFENLSENGHHGEFVDGVTEEIITELSEIDWLAIASPSSMFAIKGKSITPQKAAQDFGADYMVEGSVRQEDNSVRVTAHLIDTSNGHQLWGQRFERNVEHVLAIQRDIAEAVVSNIDWELKFDYRERARLKRGEVNVWDKVQKAMWHLFKFTTEDTSAATDILSKTVDFAPNYSLAHAGFAYAQLRKLIFDDAEDRQKAKEHALDHAMRAVALDDRSSFAQAILARTYISLGRHDLAIAHGEIAAALNPSSANSRLVLGAALMSNGQAKEALGHINAAIKLSSKDAYVKVKILTKAGCLYFLDEYEEAEACARRALEGRAIGPYGYIFLAMNLVRQDRLDEATNAIAEAQKIDSKVTVSRLRQIFDFLPPDYFSKFITDARKAGLPE